jgi:F0F1-type ATP synthase assembly protein I
MPFHSPIPEKKQPGQSEGLVGAWIQAEKLMQIALVLPCAAFIGWLGGAGLDHLLHQTWIAMVGIVLGIVAGLVGAIRMAMIYSADPKLEDKNGDGADPKGSGKSS